MSIFAETVRGKIVEAVKERTIPSIPMDLSVRLPADLTENAIRRTIEDTFGNQPRQEAAKLLAYYSPPTLLAADRLLDRLDLVGTPDGSVGDRLEAITSLVDLNVRMGGDVNIDGNRSLLTIMADYWNQIPLFHRDLAPTFDALAERYGRHPKLQGFRRWLTYDVRDGILDVSRAVLDNYGVPFQPDTHTKGFGLRGHDHRRILPDVSVEEYLGELCEANIAIADSTSFGRHIDSLNVPRQASDWRSAIGRARASTVRKSHRAEAPRGQFH